MNLEQIDTSTTAGKARVMQLAAEGRKVMDNAGGEWTPIKHPCWNWEEYSYAIIAEPVGPDEVWVVVQKETGAPLAMLRYKDLADEHSAAYAGDTQSVRYIRADLAGEAS